MDDEAGRREAARRRRDELQQKAFEARDDGDAALDALYSKAEAWAQTQQLTADEVVGVDRGWRLLSLDTLIANYLTAVQARADLPDPIRAPELFDRCVDDFAILVEPLRRALDAAIDRGELLLDGIPTNAPSERHTFPAPELRAFDPINYSRRELRNNHFTYRDLRVRRAAPAGPDAPIGPKKLKPLPGGAPLNRLLSEACDELWGTGPIAIPGERERNPALKEWLKNKGHGFNRARIRPFFTQEEIKPRIKRAGYRSRR